MKKISAALIAFFAINTVSAQYLIVGKDSISLDAFKKEYEYGLKNNGIDKTIQTTEEFLLLQQFAQDKKADSTMTFTTRLWQKENELRGKHFYPASVTRPVVEDYITENRTERQIQFFVVKKTADDKTDYQSIYRDVKAGKISMADAIKKYTKSSAEPYYIKPGTMDHTLYTQIKALPDGGYTQLVDNAGFAAFAKVLKTRPSLGYIIFGTVSYPADEKAAGVKAKIENDLKAGKKFEAVAKEYGSTDHEKNNGGIVMGSPTLPDDVYAALKGQKEGFTSTPLLKEGKYYIFHIFKIYPYELNKETEAFFFNDLKETTYAEILQDRMMQYIKSQNGFKEFPALQNLKSSYQAYAASKLKPTDVLFQFNTVKTTFADLKSVIDAKKEEAAKLNNQDWKAAINGWEDQKLVESYNADLTNHSPLKEEVEKTRKMLFSDFVFSKYLKDELDAHPEWLTDYYQKNKDKYIWENRAKGRVAIIADPELVKDIKKEIKDPKQWEFLKARFKGKLNDKSQVLVQFEEGNMSENADVFTKYNVPFKTGVFPTKIGERDLVVAIDDIIPPVQMTFEEAKDSVKDAVTQDLLNKIVAEQRAKTKITVQPGFVEALEKNFKK